MIYDKEFLLELDKQKNKTIYARITALKFDEAPLEQIEGRITQGSINIDGASSVRRTCSMTLVAQNLKINNYYWGLNTKFKLEVGVENTINLNYPKIIWFNQGIYILTTFNTSKATNNFTIQLQGKDKMCLLNGDVGGNLESSVDFGQIEEEVEPGVWVITKIPIYDIIRNMIHQYAGEPYHNIVINDIADYGLELLEYRYDTPLYLYRKIDSDAFTNILINGETVCWYQSGDSWIETTLAELASEQLDLLTETLTGDKAPTAIKFENNDSAEQFYITKVEFGDTAGYRETDLIYAGDLIANAGDSITSVLDKIKNMLGEFEYFYDLDGRFVFQQKQSFINTLYSPIHSAKEQEEYVESLATASASTYIFNGGELITTFNNNPNLLNLRNDYSIWGQRTTASGAEVPVHIRYAIDTKPVYYKTCEYIKDNGEQVISKVYVSEEYSAPGPNDIVVDWREIIYQMSKDYYQLNHKDDFELMIIDNNKQYYPKGITGYEQYYIDIEGFWRQLYNPEGYKDSISAIKENLSEKEKEYNNIESSILNYKELIIITKEEKEKEIENISKKINAFEGQISDNLSDIARYKTYQDDIPQIGREINSYINLSQSILNSYSQRIRALMSRYGYPSSPYQITSVTVRSFYNYLISSSPFDHLESKIKSLQRENEELSDSIKMEELRLIDTEQTFNNSLISLQNEIKRNEILINIYEQEIETLKSKLLEKEQQQQDYEENYYTLESDEYRYWNRNVYEQPDVLNFWFDFLDQGGELSQFNVKNLGRRSKVINDTAIKSIYFRDTPGLVFLNQDEKAPYKSGYRYIQIPAYAQDDMFTISAQGKSAKDKLDELIYQHSYCIESATINTIPIYYLQPNTRISIFDHDSGINGDYIVSKISIPLSYNGTMSITATKAVDNII